MTNDRASARLDGECVFMAKLRDIARSGAPALSPFKLAV
jgi:hypothetical protein